MHLNVSLQPTFDKFHETILDNNLEELKKIPYKPYFEQKTNNSPLQISILSKTSQELKEYLLQNELDLNYRNSSGQTSLILCCTTGNEEFLKILLESKADPNIQDENGSTALHIACTSENESLIKLLLKYEANPFLINNKGKSKLNLKKVIFQLN
jgi:ankyrin repeat protein